MENPAPISTELLKSDIPSTISALEHLMQAPDTYGGDTFRRYPGMKLGYGPDVDFFAEKLCDLAMRVMTPGHCARGSASALTTLCTGAGSRRTKNGISAMQKSTRITEKALRANESSMGAAAE